MTAGCRTPHLGCGGGSSLYEFALLRFDPAWPVPRASEQGMSLKVVDIEGPATAIFYGGGLVLSRPDQHVAWRGDAVPADSLALIDRVRGASRPS
jgi:hypothetical protein